ncbi:BlaI/MecI/CopY family transcriptional regulator [Teredinibacter turnerae]|uniref:BlaI/MecI/CopY family transcriptional regulator n=1 Tax=Teredinibacter turnerae TaxID=2426 RepID=UPI00041EA5AA|nr:BlaI/MecI/CopY family transcriptional regulator [Teredinibacter turnerae]
MTQPSSETPPLGELEIRVLEHLWANGESSAKGMHEYINEERVASANSVQSAMERLFRKGLLSRNKSSHRYLYKPLVSKADLLGTLINDLVIRFQADTPSSAAAILSAAERIDDEALDILEAEIKRRKEERQK